MSANKKSNPFLKKSTGSKPPTRNAIKAQQRKGGLGRVGHGLNSLIPPAEKEEVPSVSPAAAPVAAVAPAAAVATEPAAGNIIELPPLDILRCPWQPRSEFNEDLLRELADSIKANGIIQPPVCRRLPNGKYELIVGERRLRAVRSLGMSEVKVVIHEATDLEVAELTLIENLQREDLTPLEEAEQYRLLQTRFAMKQEVIARHVGKSRTVIANMVRLLELAPPVKELLEKAQISVGHAKVLLQLKEDEQKQIDAKNIQKHLCQTCLDTINDMYFGDYAPSEYAVVSFADRTIRPFIQNITWFTFGDYGIECDFEENGDIDLFVVYCPPRYSQNEN